MVSAGKTWESGALARLVNDSRSALPSLPWSGCMITCSLPFKEADEDRHRCQPDRWRQGWYRMAYVLLVARDAGEPARRGLRRVPETGHSAAGRNSTLAGRRAPQMGDGFAM